MDINKVKSNNQTLRNLILGIDTSNYKTSVALCDLKGNILCESRQLLSVTKGERGLRQSNALFQHIEKLPKLMDEIVKAESFNASKIAAIAVSSKPRPIENSYMPCFNAGLSLAKSLSVLLDVPCFHTSHQEGHIAAIIGAEGLLADKEDTLEETGDIFNKTEISLCSGNGFLALHLSGGTCEILKVTPDLKKYCFDDEGNHSKFHIEIVGGSKDISFGQVLDRIGVSLGMDFPSGAEMDSIAIKASNSVFNRHLSKVRVTDSYFNLSGLETQAQRIINEIESGKITNYTKENLIAEIFDIICDTLATAVTQKLKNYSDIKTVLFSGGVSSSMYISEKLKAYAKAKDFHFEFGNQHYSSDNAVGVALIGAAMYKDFGKDF